MKRRLLLLFLFFALAVPLLPALAQPPQAAVAAFNGQAANIESRLAQQHSSPWNFLAAAPATEDAAHLRTGEVAIEQMPGPAVPGALLHHWRATAFAAGATPESFERLMRNLDAYPSVYAPEVLRARVVRQQQPTRMQTFLRVRQHHVLTVVLDTTYDVSFGRLDPQHGFSTSQSVAISEVAAAGTLAERALTPAEEHGFLWRQNTYWSYEQRDGGLYLQVESLSLSRSIPRGLAWAVQPFIVSVPRESLEFTLRSTMNALRNPQTLNRKGE
jgi:hypothetical protein